MKLVSEYKIFIDENELKIHSANVRHFIYVTMGSIQCSEISRDIVVTIDKINSKHH